MLILNSSSRALSHQIHTRTDVAAAVNGNPRATSLISMATGVLARVRGVAGSSPRRQRIVAVPHRQARSWRPEPSRWLTLRQHGSQRYYGS